MDYRTAVRDTWQLSDLKTMPLLQELVQYAALAASSHNTQPWKFELDHEQVRILPDFTRRCAEVDPDDHHLFVSLGCATENLLLAARAVGRRGEVTNELETPDGDAIRITLEKAAPEAPEMFQAITSRQCTRSLYDGRSVPADELELLGKAGAGDGVTMMLLSDPRDKQMAADYVAQGNTEQIRDLVWMEELKYWLRFNEKEAVAHRDGLYAKCSGSPEVPRIVGDMFMEFAFSPRSRNKQDVANILSSSGVAIFVSDGDDKEHWIQAGRCYERFALQATALGIRNALINQPVEVPMLRQQFALWLGIGPRRPDLVVRFGYAPEMPKSLRRPVEDVITFAAGTGELEAAA